jgi:hypothetical protein
MRWWWDDGESGRQHRRKPGRAQRIKRWWWCIGKCVNRWRRIRKRERECSSTGRRWCSNR